MYNITAEHRNMRGIGRAIAGLALIAACRIAAAQGYTATDLGSLSDPGGYSYANATNGSGQVTGYTSTPSGSDHTYIWDAAHGMTDIGSLAGPQGSSVGNAINDSGQVAGSSDTAYPPYIRAFVWDPGAGMLDIGALKPD